MSGFLSEVLQTRNNVALEEYKEIVDLVENKLSSLKGELAEAMRSCFELYDADIGKVCSWCEDLTTLKSRLEEVSNDLTEQRQYHKAAKEEVEDIDEKLGVCNNNLEVLNVLTSIVKNLERADATGDKYAASKRLMKCQQDLSLVLKNFNAAEDSLWIKSLKATIYKRINDVHLQTEKEWHDTFHFEKGILKIDRESPIREMMEILQNTNQFKRIWFTFVNQIWSELMSKACTTDYIVEIGTAPASASKANKTAMNMTTANRTIIAENINHDESLDLNLDETSEVEDNRVANGHRMMIIRCSKLEQGKSSAEIVFRNITNIVSVFHNLFQENDTLMQQFALPLAPRICNVLSTNLRTLIFAKCKGDEEKASKDVTAIRSFVDHLSEEYCFIFPDQSVFQEFENSFNSLFVSQVKQDVMVKIRHLIKADLLHMVDVPEEIVSLKSEYINDPTAIHKNPYQFPRCKISKSILDMVQTLKDHLNTYPEDSGMIDSALNMYSCITTIPNPKQDVEGDQLDPCVLVLIHNNSMYLAHQAGLFPLMNHMIHPLNQKSTQAFGTMLRSIREKLNLLIAKAMTNTEDRVNKGEDISKGFVSIAIELEKLDARFENILPQRTWETALATLVDHTVNELCSSVIGWDDISSNTAEAISECFKKFAIIMCKLFKISAIVEKEIDALMTQIVSKWNRFRLLSFVLTASMRDIENKWVNGCGPLSLEFSGDEVRKLVRALFQNTDRRANFLASIH